MRLPFLSTPGQAYTDGMRFIQFYFWTTYSNDYSLSYFLPIFYRLKVYTHEYLETRFDLKTGSLAAFLFLIQKGLAAGITIYAPAIILSCTLLNWNSTLTNIFIGLLVVLYTVSGGTKAVTQTQKQQMAVMMGGTILSILIINMLPNNINFLDAVNVAGKMGRLNLVNFDFNLEDRYNFLDRDNCSIISVSILFWNRPIAGTKIFNWKIISTK